MPTPTHGVLLIADVTGYTAFLKDSELEHANGILSDLLALLVKGTRPPLTISRLEGDAVFSYGIDVGGWSGQTFVEMIESIYIAFRRAIEQMIMNTRCDCNACANIGGLDLKFIVHYGEFLIQSIGEYRELLGTDVNLTHRLGKNTITASTGIRAYAVYTDAAVGGLGISPLTGEWRRHRETYDAGEVDCWVADMKPIWEAARNRSVISIPEEEIRGSTSIEIDLPREAVWDRLTDPDYRRMLIGSDRQELTDRQIARLGTGDVYLCYHGDTVVTSEVLEWLPFTRLLTKDLIHVPGSTVYLLVDYTLASTDGETILTMTAARPTGPKLGRAVFPTVLPKLMEGAAAALSSSKSESRRNGSRLRPLGPSDRSGAAPTGEGGQMRRRTDPVCQHALVTSARMSLRSIPRTVVALGVVSFLTDLSSEMIYPLLPMFLVESLGAGAIALGTIEGVAESTAAVLNVASDRLGRRNLVAGGSIICAAIYLGFGVVSNGPALVARCSWDTASISGSRNRSNGPGSPRSHPPHGRGVAFGLYHGTIGITALPPSILFGVIYATFGIAAAFGAGAALALVATALLLRVPQKPELSPAR